MTNATMTRDEAATLYREMRSVAVREFGYTADEFDAWTRGLGPTPADFVRAAELLLECEWDRKWDRDEPWPGDEVRGMSFPKAEERPAPCESPSPDHYQWTESDVEDEKALARAEMGLVALDRPPLERN
tara:strand:- start:61 stop:447 length:387 start_codon:yes stop_codon:yes gene_type:complete